MVSSKGSSIVAVGKLVQTENGAIWTIAKSEVRNIKKSEEGTIFKSDKLFRTDSGFEFGLALTSLEAGEVGVLDLDNASKVPVKLEATVNFQQEWEMYVKVSGLPGRASVGLKVAKLFANSTRGLVVEVRVVSCEQDTAGGDFLLTVPAIAVAPGRPTKVAVAPTKSAVASIKRAMAPTKVAVAPTTKGAVATAEEAWSLEKTLEYLGEESTKKRVKERKKTTKKTKKEKLKSQENKSNKIDGESTTTRDEGSNGQKDSAKEEKQGKLEEKNKSQILKLMMEEEELEATKVELSQTSEEVEELEKEQRRSRRREEQLRLQLVEEGRSSEAMEKKLMEQVAEEERRVRRLEEQLRQLARVSQASPRLLEAATRPGAALTKEARVAPSSRNLGAIPKTRAATTKQAGSKPGASLSPSNMVGNKGQKSVERMVKLLEGRGRLASLPTPSLRHLVAQLRARLGGLSDLSLSYVEQEVARMAREESV